MDTPDIILPELQIMIKKDFHGTRLEDALHEVDILIGIIRDTGGPEQAEFITGFGVIRSEMFKLLEEYSLSPSYKLGNEGVIVVFLE